MKVHESMDLNQLAALVGDTFGLPPRKVAAQLRHLLLEEASADTDDIDPDWWETLVREAIASAENDAAPP